MKTAFISGHLDLTEDEFREHYITKISLALVSYHKFVIGDARGADLMAQMYLNNILCYAGDMTIYHMFEKPRNNIGDFPTQGGFKSDEERDAAMTAASDYDIAWIRPGREKSGTAKNLERRKLT